MPCDRTAQMLKHTSQGKIDVGIGLSRPVHRRGDQLRVPHVDIDRTRGLFSLAFKTAVPVGIVVIVKGKFYFIALFGATCHDFTFICRHKIHMHLLFHRLTVAEKDNNRIKSPSESMLFSFEHLDNTNVLFDFYHKLCGRFVISRHILV